MTTPADDVAAVLRLPLHLQPHPAKLAFHAVGRLPVEVVRDVDRRRPAADGQVHGAAALAGWNRPADRTVTTLPAGTRVVVGVVDLSDGELVGLQRRPGVVHAHPGEIGHREPLRARRQAQMHLTPAREAGPGLRGLLRHVAGGDGLAGHAGVDRHAQVRVGDRLRRRRRGPCRSAVGRTRSGPAASHQETPPATSAATIATITHGYRRRRLPVVGLAPRARPSRVPAGSRRRTGAAAGRAPRPARASRSVCRSPSGIGRVVRLP